MKALVSSDSACGSCANRAPKRSQSNPALFAELTVKGEDTCFDPQCFKEKQKAFVKMQVSIDKRKAREAAKVFTRYQAPEEPSTRAAAPDLETSRLHQAKTRSARPESWSMASCEKRRM